MVSLRTRVADFLLGDERRKLQESAQIMTRAYLDGPWLMTPENLIAQLKEVDSAYLTDLVNQLYYEQLGTLGTYSTDTEAERIRAVDESRRAYKYDPVTGQVIAVWTDFGFGQDVSISSQDVKVQEWLDEFWTADRNAALLSPDEIQEMSNDTLVDGERFLVYFVAKIDGLTTISEIDTKEITEIVTHPDNHFQKLFYKRIWSTDKISGQEMYYPDYLAKLSGALDDLPEDILPKGAKRADEQNEQTDVLIQHIPHNKKGGARGWPIMTAGLPWSREHRRFREHRSTLAASQAMFVRRVTTPGGSRAVDTMAAKFRTGLSQTQYTDTNPPPIAATLVTNTGVGYEDLPKGTGAGDAKIDGESLAWMAFLGGGIFPHYAGMGDAYRLATATSMELPIKNKFKRYRKFWQSQFDKMARIVLWAAEEYGGASFTEPIAVDVTMDKLLDFDLNTLSQVFANIFNPNYLAGLIPSEPAKGSLAQIWRIVLHLLDIADAEELTNDEAFGIGDFAPPEEEPEPEPEPAPPVVVVAPPPVKEQPEQEPGEVAEAIDRLRIGMAEMIAQVENGNGRT